MKRISITALLLLLCATLCLSACQPDDSNVTPPTGTTGTTEEITTEEVTTEDPTPTPPVNVVVNKDLIEYNFFGLEGKDYGDACFSFAEEGATMVLKQERIFFSDDVVPNQNGKKWDAATNAWVTASDVTTAERAYNIKFKENFTEGDLAIKFQFKRDGGSKQVFCIKPSGVAKSNGAVYFSNDSLSIGNMKVHLTSENFKKTNIPSDEWLDVLVDYHLSANGFSVSAVVSDEYGTVLGSLSSHPQELTVTAITGLDIIDTSTTNTADFGNAAPENPTSVWYMKNLSVKKNPMKTGDRIKLNYKTVNNSPNRGDIISNYISINGHQTIKAYYGLYALLPDCSGFICGTNDGNFYLYDIENQELVYLDRSSLSSEEQTQIHTYVNPKTGNVFYKQIGENGFPVLKKINPKTLEITTIYQAEKTMSIGLEVTNDEKYVHYTIGGWKPANVATKVGRINLETGELEYERDIVYQTEYCVNHFIINPEDPDLVLFNRAPIEADTSYNKQGTNVINLRTDERIHYEQQGASSGHALWTRDGEYITLADYITGDFYTVLSKDMQVVLEPTSMTNTSHPMTDSTRTWVIGDYSGVSLYNLETGSQYRIFTKPSNHVALGHPYHHHSEISDDGKMILYGFTNEQGVLCIGWLSNPGLTD